MSSVSGSSSVGEGEAGAGAQAALPPRARRAKQQKIKTVPLMVHLLDGNSEYVRTHEGALKHIGEKNATCDCSRSNQMPLKDQITKVPPYQILSYHLIYVSWSQLVEA